MTFVRDFSSSPSASSDLESVDFGNHVYVLGEKKHEDQHHICDNKESISLLRKLGRCVASEKS